MSDLPALSNTSPEGKSAGGTLRDKGNFQPDSYSRAHTPGPWTWERKHDLGSVPCQTLKGPTVLCRWWETKPDLTNENAADARLIAAAPDMLEALRMCADTIHSYHGDQTSYDGWQNEEVRDVWLAARAAIAKATK